MVKSKPKVNLMNPETGMLSTYSCIFTTFLGTTLFDNTSWQHVLSTCFYTHVSTSLQHVFSTLLSKKAFNTSFLHIFTTLLRKPRLQHVFATHFSNTSSCQHVFTTYAFKTSWQHVLSTCLSSTSWQHAFRTLLFNAFFSTLLCNMFFKTFLKQVFATLLHNTSIPYVLVTIHIFPTLFATRLFNMSFLQHFFTTLLYPLFSQLLFNTSFNMSCHDLYNTSLQHFFETHFSWNFTKLTIHIKYLINLIYTSFIVYIYIVQI